LKSILRTEQDFKAGITIAMESQTGDPYPSLPLKTFSGDSYTGFHADTFVASQLKHLFPTGECILVCKPNPMK
jgi:hypothetical protein